MTEGIWIVTESSMSKHQESSNEHVNKISGCACNVGSKVKAIEGWNIIERLLRVATGDTTRCHGQRRAGICNCLDVGS